jgi:hypothetical protein
MIKQSFIHSFINVHRLELQLINPSSHRYYSYCLFLFIRRSWFFLDILIFPLPFLRLNSSNRLGWGNRGLRLAFRTIPLIVVFFTTSQADSFDLSFSECFASYPPQSLIPFFSLSRSKIYPIFGSFKSLSHSLVKCSSLSATFLSSCFLTLNRVALLLLGFFLIPSKQLFFGKKRFLHFSGLDHHLYPFIIQIGGWHEGDPSS